jgi:hypothetical protein
VKIWFEAQTGIIRDAPPTYSNYHQYGVPFEARPILEAVVAKASFQSTMTIEYPPGFLRRLAELEEAFAADRDWRGALQRLGKHCDARA